jgi:hypothetical protein
LILSQHFHENLRNGIDYFRPPERPYGKSFGQWTVDWWNWAFSAPRPINPIYDNTGRFGHVNQRGPVWFLAGTFGENKIVKRTCTIPDGRGILFPVINYEINKIEKPSLRTKSELIKDVIEDINDIVKKDVIIDGESAPVYRIQSDPPTFVLRIVEGLDIDMPGGSIEAAADGYWVFLKPLCIGKHQIYFHGACSGGTRNSRAEYNVIVKPA